MAGMIRFLLLCLCLLGPMLGAPGGTVQAQTPAAGAGQSPDGQQAPDYAAWETFARMAEQAIGNPRSTNLILEQFRARTAEWRNRFLSAQSTNQARIETLRAQLAALGPAPAEGETEAAEIAERRTALAEELSRLQAPVRAAEEAFQRAEGLIREIDALLRDRRAAALMQLSPSPLNPANWPIAARELQSVLTALGREVVSAWAAPERRDEFRDKLPVILAYLLLGVILLWRGNLWIEQFVERIGGDHTVIGRKVWAFLISIGQIAVPFLGLLALVGAVRATGLVGLRGQELVASLPSAGLTLLMALWLGKRVFPRDPDTDSVLGTPIERRAEGRFHALSLGLVLGVYQLGQALLAPVVVPDAALSVLAYPFLVVTGLLVFRIGQLLRLSPKVQDEEETPGAFADRLLGLIGRLAMLIGVMAPVLAGIGYMSAGIEGLFPAVLSLGLLGLLLVFHRFVADLYVLIVGGTDADRDALLPTLVGFALVLASLPVFALIWGVREATLLRGWEVLSEGFSLGETRISPSDFLTFVLVFGIGYGVTRLLQGALRSSVLPKTRLEKGSQTAVLSGVGYVGVFLAALFAFTSAGIDLTSLALVAGALSVGIGFGLQTVVSNFVSGIILLFERPVAEGDWIEVGGVMGIVKRISVRSTVIETFDRTNVIVPNADLISGQVTNWTRFNLTGRLIVPVGVAYGTDTRKVEKILYDIAEDQPLVVLNPPPTVLFRGFGADSLNFEIRVILRDVNFMLKVQSDINHAIARRFAEEGVEIPFAQRDIWLRNPEALQPRPETGPAPAGDPAGPAPARTESPA